MGRRELGKPEKSDCDAEKGLTNAFLLPQIIHSSLFGANESDEERVTTTQSPGLM